MVLQKEQEVKEKIEAAKKEADFYLQEKKSQLEKKLAEACLSPDEKAQIKSAKEKKLQAIEQDFKEKTQKELFGLAKIKKERIDKAVNCLTDRILCLK